MAANFFRLENYVLGLRRKDLLELSAERWNLRTGAKKKWPACCRLQAAHRSESVLSSIAQHVRAGCYILPQAVEQFVAVHGGQASEATVPCGNISHRVSVFLPYRRSGERHSLEIRRWFGACHHVEQDNPIDPFGLVTCVLPPSLYESRLRV